MKDHVVPFKVSAGFARMVSDLSAGQDNRFKRLCPAEIAALSAATSSTTPKYLENIYLSVNTGLSGDAYVFRQDDYYGLVTVREGKNDQGIPVMKTDPFIIETDTTGFLSDCGYVCYHADCPTHHIDPVTYTTFRDEIVPGEPYELSSVNASLISTTVSHGIKAMNNHLSRNDSTT